MIRPWVRSYGDIWTVTLSPGKILMKFILSFPEICARITWSVSDIHLERGVGQSLYYDALQLDHVAFSQASFLLRLTEPIPKGGQRPSDVTVQHRLAVLQTAGDRVRPDLPAKTTCFRRFFLGVSSFLRFPSHQPQEIPSAWRTRKSLPSLSWPAVDLTTSLRRNVIGADFPRLGEDLRLTLGDEDCSSHNGRSRQPSAVRTVQPSRITLIAANLLGSPSVPPPGSSPEQAGGHGQVCHSWELPELRAGLAPTPWPT